MNNIFSKSPHTLFSQQIEVIQHNRLFIDDLVQDGADLHEILNRLHLGTELDTLEIRINSGGGFVKYGQQLINVIKDKFNDRCVTILEAEASSMAAILFMVGSQRVIYPHSVLMVHDVSMYMGGKANETRKQMATFVPVFTAYFKDIFKDTMSDEEIAKMFDGEDYWFDAEQMCLRGMADCVIVNGNTITADEYLGSVNPETPEKKEEKPAKKKKSKKSKKKKVTND